MVNNSVTNNPKLTEDSCNTCFITTVEKLNNDIKNSTEKYTTKNMAKTMPRTLPDANLLPTTANEIKNV
jgi:hypothetical protein